MANFKRKYPLTRLRRLRSNKSIRDLVAENKLSIDDLIQPIFVKESLNEKEEIESLGIEVKTIVAGGTPTFPIHSKRDNIEVSPGTSLLWDERYGGLFKDLNFLHAGVLVGSIISRPSEDIICLNFFL